MLKKRRKRTATPSLAPDTSLQIKRTFAASQQTLFDAWTKPERLKKWFLMPNPGMESTIHEADLRFGGKIRAEVQNKEGKTHRLLAVFKEIVPIENWFTSGRGKRACLAVARAW